MIKLKLILSIVFIYCFCSDAFSQAIPPPPEVKVIANKYFNYQSVLRDTNGNLLKNVNINIQAKLLFYRKTDSIAYIETFKTTTNSYGLINLKIGSGTNVFGSYLDIDWSQRIALGIEIDENGGNNYHLISVSQIFSVPYSLYSFRSAVSDNVILTSPKGYNWNINIDDNGNLSSSYTFVKCGDKFLDLRNNKGYTTVKIGERCWMSQNLNYGKRISSDSNQVANGVIEKYCYNNQESNCDTYGALYQWDEMRQNTGIPATLGICPQNWHVPFEKDWADLITALGGDSLAGGTMKMSYYDFWFPPNTGATNKSNFSALPGGDLNNGIFSNLGYIGSFWSAYDDAGLNLQPVRKVYYNSTHIDFVPEPKTKAVSVRCIMNY